ncbi:hypothetical protein AB0B66_09200 [Catellatospora sp. NPDC049111]|uniref:hypothetical protein n=1 Tax=Catellatospora sp. NPDC049111 TaxID=3155271 RepID=UPI0033CBDD7A
MSITIVVPGHADLALADDLAVELGTYPRVEGTADERTIDLTVTAIVFYTAVQIFLSSMLQQFGIDAAARLTRVFERLRRRVPAPETEVRLVDEANLITFVVGEDACRDPRAMVSLLRMEREIILPGVELRWDSGAGRWTGRGRGEVSRSAPA